MIMEESSSEAQDEDNNVWESEVSASEVDIVDEARLKALYREKNSLLVMGNGYTLLVKGEDIGNYDHSLENDIELKREEQGLSFTLNEGNYLPGPVYVQLFETAEGSLYLFNEEKQAYARIKTDDLNEFTLTTPGHYVISSENLAKDHGRVWEYILWGAATRAADSIFRRGNR